MKRRKSDKKHQKEDDNMPVVIENIVKVQRSESDKFMKLQKRRISQLEAIQEKKQGDQRKKIIRELQSSGILDKSGNLSKNYR